MNSHWLKLFQLKIVWGILIGLALYFALILNPTWYELLKNQWENLVLGSSPINSQQDDSSDPHAGHDHDSENNAIELSDQALQNIGLTNDKIQPVAYQTFQRTITVPALIVEKPGKTHVEVSAPMTGVVTALEIIKGESVSSQAVLFRLRLTHEDLVEAQSNFLRTLGELDVENREINRLKKISQGVVAGKILLEREYEKEKLEAILKAQEEALLLHGLSLKQVEHIAQKRELLSELIVRAPLFQSPDHLADQKMKHQSNFIVQDLLVHKGQAVMAGETLCVLSNLSELYIEGQAFEQEADQLEQAMVQDWEVQAIRQRSDQEAEVLQHLKIVFIENIVNVETRALRFYVRLPNRIIHQTTTVDGNRYIHWKFKPGQRLQLLMPVEQWKKQIVLPVEAVSKDGSEYFVFVENGHKFDRRSVHVKYRDQFWTVIADDGSLFVGERVALTGAHQMQMALKNKSGQGGHGHGHPHPH